jgi:tetratricopeptide (TPR) repeat protein
MKTLLIIVFLITTTNSFSQSIFPGLSPKGRIEQMIGLTNITVDYERPAARGRKVFGELVKYEKLWRTGAGNCTKISFSKSVIIDNKKINKGTYSVFTIPNTNEWTVILNTDTTLYGVGSYDERKDLLRFKAKTQSTDRYYESLSIDIDVKPNNAIIYIAWEKTQISFQVETETDKVANDFIQQYLLTDKSKNSDEYAAAAEYYFYLNKDLDRALILIDKAIGKKNESWYYRQKIDLLEKQMKYKEAIDCANLAISLDQKRTEWDLKTKEQSEEEYKKRIEFFKSRLKKSP